MATLVLGAGFLSVAAMAAPASYDLVCRHDKTATRPVLFRLTAHYTIEEDGSAELSRVAGILVEDESLTYQATFATEPRETWKNDAHYRPRGETYKDHVRFELKTVAGGDTGGASPNELIVARTPSKTTRKPFDNRVNTGTEVTYTFHAGLEYHFSDQDGNRAELECTAVHYEIDRR